MLMQEGAKAWLVQKCGATRFGIGGWLSTIYG